MYRSGQTLIEAHQLVRRYGTGRAAVSALQDVSFSISAGEFVAVSGPSGSGKSSLMNLIGLLDRPTSGKFCFLGSETSRLTDDRCARLRNKHIGFVFQSYHLLPRRTALKNVELPLIYRGIRQKERSRRAAAALERVALSSRAQAYPGELSGGEQQRVAIARALVTEPNLIVADEPTGALDSATGVQIMALFETACGEGHTVLLVTHDPMVAAHAGRQIHLHDGRIKADGPTSVMPPPVLPNALRRAS